MGRKAKRQYSKEYEEYYEDHIEDHYIENDESIDDDELFSEIMDAIKNYKSVDMRFDYLGFNDIFKGKLFHKNLIDYSYPTMLTNDLFDIIVSSGKRISKYSIYARICYNIQIHYTNQFV